MILRGQANRGGGGFTLIEAMLASTLLMIVLVMLGQIQNSARMTLERVRASSTSGSISGARTGSGGGPSRDSRSGRAGGGRAAGGATSSEQDLVRGFNSFSRDCAQFQNPGFLRKGQPVVELSQVSGDTTQGKVTFYSAGYGPAGTQDIRRITYEMTGRGLERQDQPPSPSPSGSHLAARKRLLVPGAKELEIALFDGRDYIRDWGRRLGVPQGLQLRFLTHRGERQVWSRPFRGTLR